MAEVLTSPTISNDFVHNEENTTVAAAKDKHWNVRDQNSRTSFFDSHGDIETTRNLMCDAEPKLGTEGSPRHVRSPRCEAFVMTGEKMLNLNPKISPCYAKVCQNQLPPTAEVDVAEKMTPKCRQFDQFPSMHKNGRRRMQSVTTTPGGHTLGLGITPNIPESQSENILDYGNCTVNGKCYGGQQIESLKNSECFRDSGGNIIPADPSSTNIQHYHQSSSISTLPEQLSAREEEQQLTLIGNCNNIASTISRFLASHSQSTPSSPAHMLFFKQQQEQKHMFENEKSQPKSEEHGNHHPISSQNRNSSDAVVMVQSMYSPDTISRLARHLFTHQEGIKIAAFLVKSDDLSMAIAHHFVSLFNFAGIRIDAALRMFFLHVYLTGQSDDRSQLLFHFAQRYYECNPTVFNSVDQIHTLACALLLLNTDLYGKHNNKKISCRDFIENLSKTEHKYDAAMLKELYSAIKEQPFYENDEHALSQPIGMGHEKRISQVFVKNSNSCLSNKAMINPEQQVDYKHGWLLKKSVYDADGKKTPIGRRKWQMQYATIRGMVIYLHPNESGFSSSRYIAFKNCILLHHSLAEIPRDYTKRKNVFRLRTANLGEVLFQTSDQNEVQQWIDAINFVAATFSTPALPTPVSSSGAVAFYKPHLPSIPTHLSSFDQLRMHEMRLEETTKNLAQLRQNAPPIKAKGRVVFEYFQKDRFLEKERERYSVYVTILSQQREEKIVYERTHKAGERPPTAKPPTAKLAKPAGGWDEDFVGKLARASSTIRCDAQIATTSSVNIAGKSQLNNGAIESVNEK